MRKKVDGMWRDTEDIGETQGAGSVGGLGIWPATAEGRRSKQKESREGGCRKIGGSH